MGKIFVYGSLMEGFFNYEIYLKGKVLNVEKGYMLGTLYHLKNKGYPGYVDCGNDRVYGEIITYDGGDETLASMDHLEGYSGFYDVKNSYNRKSIRVMNSETLECDMLDVYVYNPNSPKNSDDDRVYLEDGCWSNYQKLN
ncbi:MAG: gamma-glutamylcyclotransferase [Tissierellales bacterium]|nr:gamma-glutamylcyclotransferase [Tissierellales bacterium]